ncbi:FAD:protein FMN transferase [Deinococcus sp.]|uniref:FAD:protein FMN transferase n=1 Tax=Deinococcus sp. TaxID=47478 RepID=UPI003B599F20
MKWPRFSRPPRRRVRHFEGVLGTALELQLLANTDAQLDAAEAALLTELDRLELIFSRFVPESELNRFLGSVGQSVAVSPEFAAVLAQAQHFITLTGGAFHPASDALARLWAAGEPDEQSLSGVLAQMREPLWTLQAGRATLHTTLGLNFNALAKGHIADQAAAAALASAGVRAVLLNLGGDVRHLGASPVQVGVESFGLRSDTRAPLLHLETCQQAVATSGHGHRGAHLFDPRTGYPTPTDRAVSVLAPTCAEADALSTAFCVLDISDSLRLADSLASVGVLIQDGATQRSNAFWQRHQVQEQVRESALTPL